MEDLSFYSEDMSWLELYVQECQSSVRCCVVKSLHPVHRGVTLECEALRAEAVKGLEEWAEAAKALSS